MDGVPVAVKPKVVDAPADSPPLKEALVTVTAEPLVDKVPFHNWLMLCPLSSVHLTAQPLTAEPPAVTVTRPWNPPGQEFCV